MTQFIRREDGESWRRVVERIAMPQGAQTECLQVFDLLVGESMTDEDAAKEALKEMAANPPS